jgi:uncharacterized protein (DUF1330 family)
MPRAFMIVDAKVSNEEKYAGYKALSPGAVAAAGGKFIARGGEVHVLEGSWKPARAVVVEFASIAAAKAFYDSEKYLAARAARAGATEFFNAIIVEGLPE